MTSLHVKSFSKVEARPSCLRIKNGDSVDWLYESMDIIRYLDERFSTSSLIPEKNSEEVRNEIRNFVGLLR